MDEERITVDSGVTHPDLFSEEETPVRVEVPAESLRVFSARVGYVIPESVEVEVAADCLENAEKLALEQAEREADVEAESFEIREIGPEDGEPTDDQIQGFERLKAVQRGDG